MEKQILTVKKRSLTGRKVKSLRQQNILPANIYGQKIKSLSIQASLNDFKKIFDKTGETTLVYLQVEGEKETRPTLVHNIQLHPVTDSLLHVDFHQVRLDEKTTAQIPVELIGESPAVNQGGVVVTLLNEIEVEALPANLPEKLTIDVGLLKEINDSFKVSQLKAASSKVTILADEDLDIVKIEPPSKEEEKEPETKDEIAEEKQPTESKEDEKTKSEDSGDDKDKKSAESEKEVK